MTTNTNVPEFVQCYWIVKRNGVFDEHSNTTVHIAKSMDDCFKNTQFTNHITGSPESMDGYLLDSVWLKPHVKNQTGDCLRVMAKDLYYAYADLHFASLDNATKINLCLASLKTHLHNFWSIPRSIREAPGFLEEALKVNDLVQYYVPKELVDTNSISKSTIKSIFV